MNDKTQSSGTHLFHRSKVCKNGLLCRNPLILHELDIVFRNEMRDFLIAYVVG